LIILAVLLAGTIYAGGLFNFIDIIIVRPIVNILFLIYNLIGDFGTAIIVFALLVRLAMIPLTKKQLYQTRLMRKLQPKLVEIKKNCNGNRQLESLQTMDLYKRYNVKPMSSILTLCIQLPILIAVFSAIQVIATPKTNDNLSNRVYDFVAYDGSTIKSIEEKQQAYLADLTNEEIPAEEKTAYDFHPQLFGLINLDVKASEVFTNFSWSALFIFICALAAAATQYFATKQQMATNKSKQTKKFRDFIKAAEQGNDVDQNEINNFATGQMSKMMPLLMFFIMFNLHGALAFYYFLGNLITMVQQKIILHRAEDEMDSLSDKSILKELKGIQEGEVIENKKTGTKITRISAKSIKKKRR